MDAKPAKRRRNNLADFALPQGWTVSKRGPFANGRYNTTWTSDTGKKFRSINEIRLFLGAAFPEKQGGRPVQPPPQPPHPSSTSKNPPPSTKAKSKRAKSEFPPVVNELTSTTVPSVPLAPATKVRKLPNDRRCVGCNKFSSSQCANQMCLSCCGTNKRKTSSSSSS